MIGHANVTFKKVEVPIETVRDPSDDDKRVMDVVEITYPDGKVTAFPADDVSPETGRRYRDMYAGKYRAFKDGDPDPDRVKQLEREIKDRQNELEAMRNKPKDDERVQENLGYGKVKPDEDPHSTAKPGKIDQPAALGKPSGDMTGIVDKRPGAPAPR